MRTYLRYEQEASWGCVVSGAGHVALDASGKLAISPSLESVAVWNLKTGALVKQLRPAAASSTASEVTALHLGADGDTLAVGYANGAIRVWSLSDGAEALTLNGHKSAVTALRLDRGCTRLVSGGKDTAVIVWDVVAEAGVCRLRGHKDMVTDLCLLEAHNALATVSKDGTMRLWDLDTQHCVQHVMGDSGELWSVDCDAACERLITGGANAELLAWRPWRGVHATKWGELTVRASTNRVAMLRFGLDDGVVAVQFADRNLALYSVQSEAQLKRQLKRKQKKRKEKLEKRQEANASAKKAPPPMGDGGDDDDDDDGEAELGAADAYLPLTSVRAPHKLHSFAFMPRQRAASKAAASIDVTDPEALAALKDEPSTAASANSTSSAPARLLLAMRNNEMAIYACELSPGGSSQPEGPGKGVSSNGHRTEPRALALSANETMALSASDGEAKLWSLKSQECLGTLPCGYGLSCVFMLAAKYAVVGTKAGTLQIYCLATKELVSEVEGHGGAVWSLIAKPGSTTLLSGSADKSIALWAPIEGGKRGETPNTATLREEARHALGEDVLCARFTADAKHVAVALLDASIKVVFSDSLELFLTLFGHKLPVLSVSCSSDNSLLVSGSADKTIKIWGLDFGDCHRSLLGHHEAVMAVAFVRETHYFFSASKDRTVRYWDADRFEQILVLHGHHAEVWACCPSRGGAFVATASRDRTLRLWRRTDEQVFVEEEREAALEQVFEQSVLKGQEAQEDEAEEAEAMGLETGGGGQSEAGLAGRRTIESIKGAERVLEALKVLAEEADRVAEYEKAAASWDAKHGGSSGADGGTSASGSAPKRPVLVPNMLLLGLNEGNYLLKAISQVRSTELEQALLLLPFDSAIDVLRRLLPLLPYAPPAELMCRTVIFLVKVHQKAITASAALIPLLHGLETAVMDRLQRLKAMVGYNVAAMKFLRQKIEQKNEAKFYAAQLDDRKANANGGAAGAAGSSSGTVAGGVAELRRRTVARQNAKGGKRGSKRKAS